MVVSRSVYGSSPARGITTKEVNNPGEAIRINPEFPQSIQQWENEIVRASQETGIDPNLISAVILQESGGQPQVISSSGAVGLMQVMARDGIASTFSCINGPCFSDRPSIKELMDPAFNIQYGSRFLAALISREGSLRAALHAYGPMDVGFAYADAVLSIYQTFN